VRVVRIDVLLILKLIAVVFVLSQDGSTLTTCLLSAAAFVFYLQQTGMQIHIQGQVL
jgi:hypothetical protein